MEVHVNAAMSIDGKLATRDREQVRISGSDDWARVADLRADSDAVLVGVGTVLADDPSLTVDGDRAAARRDRGAPPQPTRVVADSCGRTPPDAAVLDDAAPTVLLVSDAIDADRATTLEAAGATLVRTAGERVDLDAAMADLAARDIGRLLVEGGGEIVYSCCEAGLVDRLTVFVGPVIIGGRDAPTLADGVGFTDEATFAAFELQAVDRIDDGALLTFDAE